MLHFLACHYLLINFQNTNLLVVCFSSQIFIVLAEALIYLKQTE